MCCDDLPCHVVAGDAFAQFFFRHVMAAPVVGCHLVKVSCLDASGGDLHSYVTPPRDQLVASMK